MRAGHMTVAAVAVAVSLALSGCSAQATLQTAFAPQPRTVEATVAAVNAPVEGTLPDGLAGALPLWPGARVSASKTTKTPQGTSHSVILTTRDPYADVLAGVGEGLKRASWKVEATDASTPKQKASLLMISSADAEGIVTINQASEELVSIQYVITPKK